MKSIIKISKFLFVCALCADGFSSALGASSVRSLGGSGTYKSASAVKLDTSAGTARASSARITPATVSAGAMSSAKKTATTNSARAATNQRLSAGSYLSGGKTVSGGSSIKSQNVASSGSSGASADLINRIDDLQQAVDDLQDSDADQYNKSDVDGFLNDKQDTLTVGPGIDITNNVISVIGGADGREVELSANATHIQWRYAGDATWSDLVPLSDLTGAQGNEGKSVELRVDSNILQWRRVGDVAWANLLDLSLLAPSVDLTNYYTKSDADARYATAAQGAKADNALQDDAPTDGYDYVLMFNSGQKIWAQVY